MKEYSIQQLAYLAGILDGEGCLKPSKAWKNPSCFSLRCEVSNTDKDLISWLYKTFGGYTAPIKRSPPQKPQYRWRLRVPEMKLIIPQVLPYLVTKRNEAKWMIAQFKIRKQGGLQPWLIHWAKTNRQDKIRKVSTRTKTFLKCKDTSLSS